MRCVINSSFIFLFLIPALCFAQLNPLDPDGVLQEKILSGIASIIYLVVAVFLALLTLMLAALVYRKLKEGIREVRTGNVHPYSPRENQAVPFTIADSDKGEYRGLGIQNKNGTITEVWIPESAGFSEKGWSSSWGAKKIPSASEGKGKEPPAAKKILSDFEGQEPQAGYLVYDTCDPTYVNLTSSRYDDFWRLKGEAFSSWFGPDEVVYSNEDFGLAGGAFRSRFGPDEVVYNHDDFWAEYDRRHGDAEEPDSFQEAPDSFPEEPDFFPEAPDSFPEAPDSFPEAPDSFQEAPDSFPEEPDYFQEEPDSFQKEFDSFQEEPDSFPEEPDYFSEAPDYFPEEPDYFPEEPDSFQEEPDFFQEEPDSFQEEPDSFQEESDVFPEDDAGPEVLDYDEWCRRQEEYDTKVSEFDFVVEEDGRISY